MPPSPPPPRRASLHTLGCRLNQAESFLLRDKLAAAGYAIVPFGECADLVVINTCAVTRLAAAKCRQIIRQCAAANPRAYTAVVGCYSQLGAKELASIPGVDLVLGNNDKLNLLDYIGDGAKNTAPLVVRERVRNGDFSIPFADGAPFNKRANIKVQDGCDFGCSFCAIPLARGRARSRDFDNILDEARSLAARGVRELVLTGVNIGLYAGGGNNLADLADALAQVPGIDRLRVGSIEPATVPERLIASMADPAHPLMPSLHLPAQSGCARILRDMRRHYTKEEYAAFAREALARVPGLCLGTDLMVGFPGETDAEFEETCAFFAETPFAYAHVFTYSEREGAPAARRADAVPAPVRQRRGALLRRLSAARHREFLAAHVGRAVRVLFEDPREDHWPGLTENYLRVLLPASRAAGRDLTNQMALVRLDAAGADFLEGTLLD
jgi:threonylcarbamoyladenosine tRNA methylthiotransferase MtaB